MRKKRVSLILTTYDSCENLRKTLSSIDAQSYSEIEINIKDGGSTDDTINIIKGYEKKGKYQLNWISRSDSGIYDAMNQGYHLATGDIIVFFNDEFIDQDAVKDMVSLIELQIDCIGAHADLIYAFDGKVIRKWKMGKQKSIYTGWLPGHPTLFLKREVYERYGLYKTDYNISADYEFMVRLFKDKANHIAYLPRPIISMFYGGTSNQSIKSYFISWKEGNRALRENGYRGALCIDMARIIRVLLQFI